MRARVQAKGRKRPVEGGEGGEGVFPRARFIPGLFTLREASDGQTDAVPFSLPIIGTGMFAAR